jgi:hypothetical protein
MRKERVYIVFLIISVILFVLSEFLKPEEVDWSEDHTRTKSIPYATEILFDEIGVLFPAEEIRYNDETLYYFENETSAPKNWIFVNSQIELDELETEILLENVKNGDQVFFAGAVTGFLMDTLNVEYEYYYSIFDSTFTQDSLSLSLNSPIVNINRAWRHDADITFNHITSYDSSRTTELGSWENGKLNFIRTDIGAGSIYINSNPQLFTNYYLRKPEYAEYAFSALSHLPVRTTIWDTYYKNGRQVSGSPLYVILNTRYLRQAWYLAIITLIMFMIFRARRRQRIIPIMNPPENSTLEFTRTIGLLYLEQGNHKDILTKKVQFFLDYVKTHMRLDTTDIDEQFKTDLSQRSGVPKNEVFKLFDLIELTQESKKITDTELKQVTDRIDQFYKQSQR